MAAVLLWPCAVGAIDFETLFSNSNLTPQMIADEITETHTYFSVVANSAHTGRRINAAGTTIQTPLQQVGIYNHAVFVDSQQTIPVKGQFLPNANQVNPNSPTATYNGGIEGATAPALMRRSLQRGACLCTGFITTEDYEFTNLTMVPAGFTQGVEGPNCGEFGNFSIVDGTTSNKFGFQNSDWDFDDQVVFDPGSSDAAVLEFQVAVKTPGYLRVSLVYGSEENPSYLNQQFNDSVAVFVKGPNDPTPQNIFTFREPNGSVKPFTLQDLVDCPKLYEKNRPAPAPLLPSGISAFADLTTLMGSPTFHYDHEINAFTALLTRETGDDPSTNSVVETNRLAGPLKPSDPPVIYTIKIVVQDVADEWVDATVFVPQDGVQFIAILPADFNMDGIVDVQDLNIIGNNWQQSNKKYKEGDANGDGTVDGADLNIFSLWHLTNDGDKYPLNDDGFTGDFNGDGTIDIDDFLVYLLFVNESSPCFSRFEADANHDGTVDSEDYDILVEMYLQ